MALREVLAHFGFTFDRGQLAAAGKAVDGVKSKVQSTGRGLADVATGLRAAFAGFVANEIANVTSAIAEQAASLADLSEQTSLSTDDLQAWTLAANLGGASAADFTTGLRKLSKELATGVDESGQQSKLFRNLGIDTKDSAGKVRELSDVLPEIAEKFKGLQSGAEKSALAQQIFGRAGSKLVPLLSQGAEGVAKLREQFEALGGGFSKEAIANADEYDDALVKLNFSFFGLKSLLATQVFPALSRVVETLTHASVSASKWLKETTALGTGVKLLAGLLAGKLALALAPYLLPGLKFLAIFLAIDDLLAFLEGKDSIIGALLNRAFGHGTATAARKWCNDAKEAIKGLVAGGFDLLKIAVSSNSAEIDALGDHFFTVTTGITNAIDAVIAKVRELAETMGLIPKVDGLTVENNDAVEKGKTAKNGKGLTERAFDFLGLTGGGLSDPNSAAFKENQRNQAIAALRRGAAQAGTAQSTEPPRAALTSGGGAPVTNNISPIQVTQTFAPGTGPDVRRVAKEAAVAGVKQGLNEYRAALQSVEQRAP